MSNDNIDGPDLTDYLAGLSLETRAAILKQLDRARKDVDQQLPADERRRLRIANVRVTGGYFRTISGEPANVTES